MGPALHEIHGTHDLLSVQGSNSDYGGARRTTNSGVSDCVEGPLGPTRVNVPLFMNRGGVARCSMGVGPPESG
jgi:hypothetical protein